MLECEHVVGAVVQSCLTLCNPWTVAHQAPPPMGFSRQEYKSGLPFPSPMHESEKWNWSHSVVSNSSRPHGPGSSIHGIFQARVLEWGAIYTLSSPRLSTRANFWINVCLPAVFTDPLWEKAMASHSSILAWRIPWAEEPGGLQSTRLQRVRKWSERLHFHFHFTGPLI